MKRDDVKRLRQSYDREVVKILTEGSWRMLS